MKKTITLLFLLTVAISLNAQKAKVKKHAKKIFKAQKELLENQIKETKNILKKTDPDKKTIIYDSYTAILEKLEGQLEELEENGVEYYYSGNTSPLSDYEKKLVGKKATRTICKEPKQNKKSMQNSLRA